MYKKKNERIIATIEARMTSSRLPGKVLRLIAGMPALEMLIMRLKQSKYLDGICIATTVNAADEPIVALGERLNVLVFRGSEADVLGRVLGAAKYAHADVIVEITSDCPFVDAELIDRGVAEYFEHEVDYVGNTTEPDHQTFANGFDVQVFSTKVLKEVDALTQDPVDRTHVSYYIYTHKDRFRCHNFEADKDTFGPDLRVTLDEEKDYNALCVIADALYPSDPYFSARSITQYLRAHPEVIAMNAAVAQKEAYEL